MSEPEVIVVSNRVPDPNSTHAGGLTVALEGLKKGVWLGPNDTVHPETRKPFRSDITPEGSSLTYTKFACAEDLYKQNYLLCSEEIWMSFHGIKANYPEVIPDEKITAYEKMACMIAREIKSSLAKCAEPDNAVIKVEDFHNMSVAKALREEGVTKNPLGFFLHIPFPSNQDMEVLPVTSRRQVENLMVDLLQYDLVGFQTPDDAKNFLTFARKRGAVPSLDDNSVVYNGRRIVADVFPVGINPEYGITSHARPSSDPDVQRILAEDRKIVLGVDRIDPAKNLPHKIRAYGKFLESFEGAADDVCFVQVAPMSRESSHYYRDERETVKMEVDAVNQKFGTKERPAIILLNRTIDHSDVYQLHARADVFAVFSRDGAMLGAYEYPAAKEGFAQFDPNIVPGTLIISKGAGAHTVVGENAILIGHDDSNAFAAAIPEALTMPADMQKRNHDAMMQKISANSDEQWLNNFIVATQQAHERRWEPKLVTSLTPVLAKVRQLLPITTNVTSEVGMRVQ